MKQISSNEKKFVETVHKSMHEVIDYFFDDPEQAKGMLKLDKPLCPASYAMYCILKRKEGFGNFTKDGELKHTDFCHKAIMLLPRMFDMRAPLIVPQIKEIMASARGRIDMLGKKFGIVDKNSSSKDYAKWDRLKLIKVRGDEYRSLDIDFLIERLKRRYTKSEDATIMYAELKQSDDNQIDATYQTKAIGLSHKLTAIEDEEFVEIQKLKENYIAIEEMRDVIDYYAFLYKGVILSPSVVNGKGENPKLFKISDEVVRDEFEEECFRLEAYHPEICESLKEC